VLETYFDISMPPLIGRKVRATIILSANIKTSATLTVT
jgi:hypothetical protein